MNEALLRDYIEVGRTNNVQTAIQTKTIETLVKSIDTLDNTLNNGPINKLCSKVDNLWKLVIGAVGSLITLLGVAFVIILNLLKLLKA